MELQGKFPWAALVGFVPVPGGELPPGFPVSPLSVGRWRPVLGTVLGTVLRS